MDRFIMTNAIDGWQVSDAETGHPLTEPAPSFIAQQSALELNAAARRGPQALARALGALEPETA